ncbi:MULTISPECIES: hypothetical protein [Rhodanobacter]|uniref:Uncharacterized protein n=1 Tax=Rhodanobacter sp. IGA1.0 TaxID=3158582 RepID=A0AAU7QNA8_9GAMM|nr:hypothetical protein [Rhodanobacter spathiphylli]
METVPPASNDLLSSRIDVSCNDAVYQLKAALNIFVPSEPRNLRVTILKDVNFDALPNYSKRYKYGIAAMTPKGKGELCRTRSPVVATLSNSREHPYEE